MPQVACIRSAPDLCELPCSTVLSLAVGLGITKNLEFRRMQTAAAFVLEDGRFSGGLRTIRGADSAGFGGQPSKAGAANVSKPHLGHPAESQLGF